VLCAAIVLAATLAGVVWLLTYQVSYVAHFAEDNGTYSSLPGREHPWWAAFAAVLVAAVGAATTMWVLPAGGRAFRRLTNRLLALR
jgi:hypothetical protein